MNPEFCNRIAWAWHRAACQNWARISKFGGNLPYTAISYDSRGNLYLHTDKGIRKCHRSSAI